MEIDTCGIGVKQVVSARLIICCCITKQMQDVHYTGSMLQWQPSTAVLRASNCTATVYQTGVHFRFSTASLDGFY